MASSASGWSEVPSDILWLIIQRLPIADYIRFGAVCASWSAAIAEKRRQPAPQVPWLMLIPNAASKTSSSSSSSFRVKFLSLSENKKEYHIDLPPEFDHRHIWIGSSNGWLISVDEDWDIHMFNPISRSHARLRSTITDFLDITPEIISLNLTENMRKLYFRKVVVQSPSSITPERKLVVAVLSNLSHNLIIVDQREESKFRTTIPPDDYCRSFVDIIFYGDYLFAIGRSGWLLACDMSVPCRPKVSFSVGPPRNRCSVICYRKFLIEFLSGDLLHVSVDWYSTSTPVPVIGVVNMDPIIAGSKKEWIELKSLGDHAIFLDYNQSHILFTQDFPELKRNSVYIGRGNLGNYSSGAYAEYNSEDGTFIQHEPNVADVSLWFAPIFNF